MDPTRPSQRPPLRSGFVPKNAQNPDRAITAFLDSCLTRGLLQRFFHIGYVIRAIGRTKMLEILGRGFCVRHADSVQITNNADPIVPIAPSSPQIESIERYIAHVEIGDAETVQNLLSQIPIKNWIEVLGVQATWNALCDLHRSHRDSEISKKLFVLLWQEGIRHGLLIPEDVLHSLDGFPGIEQLSTEPIDGACEDQERLRVLIELHTPKEKTHGQYSLSHFLQLAAPHLVRLLEWPQARDQLLDDLQQVIQEWQAEHPTSPSVPALLKAKGVA